jgi:hypothetical protein
MEVYQEVFQWIAILRFKKVIEKVQNRWNEPRDKDLCVKFIRANEVVCEYKALKPLKFMSLGIIEMIDLCNMSV